MSEDPSAKVHLLRSQKAKLIDILSGDADFVLQHADSRCLLSRHGYQQVKACRVPSEKVTELLDHIIQRGPEAVQGLLDLLNEQTLQENFPMLSFTKDLQVNVLSPGIKETIKRKPGPCLEETVSSKQIRRSSILVKEKQLMILARTIGRSWREIGRLALDIPSVKLEQIEEDHSLHVERVFAMLRLWRTCQKEKATAAHLHSQLSQEGVGLSSESIDFLLESD